jgi:hypothetical protein
MSCKGRLPQGWSLNYGGYSGRDDEIDMMTRSMLQIMLEFTAIDQAAGALSGPPLRVVVTDTPPQDAYVAVQYDRRWFWIADTDIQSKNTFAIIMLLFSIADTGVKGLAPIVTIPAQ